VKNKIIYVAKLQGLSQIDFTNCATCTCMCTKESECLILWEVYTNDSKHLVELKPKVWGLCLSTYMHTLHATV